ncbi:hypothetical protein RRG08_012218 [Elysia crispata]|uniref:Uncharacterized protein n=1 Tax=Elysia crispata TaxID=231223 RepID=A0AAE1DAF8_9GAST|nr:hypothetical protein RRG08_012218 [Elysia crispata]
MLGLGEVMNCVRNVYEGREHSGQILFKLRTKQKNTRWSWDFWRLRSGADGRQHIETNTAKSTQQRAGLGWGGGLGKALGASLTVGKRSSITESTRNLFGRVPHIGSEVGAIFTLSMPSYYVSHRLSWLVSLVISLSQRSYPVTILRGPSGGLGRKQSGSPTSVEESRRDLERKSRAPVSPAQFL